MNETPMYYVALTKDTLPTENVKNGSYGIIYNFVVDFHMGVYARIFNFDHGLDYSKIYNLIINDAQLTKGYFPTILILSLIHI